MPPSSEPGDRRPPESGRPTLERAPGERYRVAEASGAPARPRSTARAVGIGALVALAGAVLIVVLGGVFSLSAGLIVLAGAIGWWIGRVVAATADPSRGSTIRWIVAVALALDAVVLGQLGLWVHSLSQGGALGLIDYLVEARGLLVPAEILVAVALAWWSAR